MTTAAMRCAVRPSNAAYTTAKATAAMDEAAG